MNNNEWLEIHNIKEFTDFIRNIVYVSFLDSTEDEETYEIDISKSFETLTKAEKEEMEEVLNTKECSNIILENSRRLKNKKTKKIKYLINDQLLHKIIESINQRMVSNIIAKLVKKGVLESAFDEEKNDFVFWNKEKDK